VLGTPLARKLIVPKLICPGRERVDNRTIDGCWG